MKCSRDINLGRGGTRDLRRHQETKLYKHSEKDGVGVLPLQSYFGPIREEFVIRAEVLFAYFFGEHLLALDHCTKLFKLMFPDSSIVCSHTKATAVLKVMPRIVRKPFLQQLERLNTSASKLMRQLILPLNNKLLLCFDSSITPKDR